ncbi:MAG: lycopene cyclase domain-containing protein [Chloroflexi bacterium]|nr:lycopene cyclase domain-containing protein [Chloroflexota bacterium]
MTYFGFLLVFLVVPIAVLGVWLRRRIDARWRLCYLVVAGLALAYTSPWDNFIVADGVWTWPAERVVGLKIGLVPIEEYTFFVLQVALAGLVVLALERRDAERRTTED